MSIQSTDKRYINLLETALGETLMRLLQDDDVIEIMVNPNGYLVIDRLSTGKTITDTVIASHISENIIKLMAAYKNLEINAEHPMIASDMIFNGARFQGWLPPVVANPCFAIRKRAVRIFTLDEYTAAGSLTKAQANQLKNALIMRKNIIIAGGTSCGKTTFANALLHELNTTTDRFLILEDLPELQMKTNDSVFMCTTPSVSMRDLVKGAMRMRPDRIIIGEVRDGAALELLKAWNTGHPGGICTIHANNAISTLQRLEDLIQEVSVNLPRQLILEAVDLIVYIKKDTLGKRVIDTIAELIDYRDGAYIVRD